MPKIDYGELEEMPTLAEGQAADLKIDTGSLRVWLARTSIPDGETRPIQVEQLQEGRWVDITGDNDDPRVTHFKDHYLDGDWAGLYVTAVLRPH